MVPSRRAPPRGRDRAARLAPLTAGPTGTSSVTSQGPLILSAQGQPLTCDPQNLFRVMPAKGETPEARAHARFRCRVSASGHKWTFHMLIRHVRFSVGTGLRDAIG